MDYVRETFANQRVQLDGNTFEQCVFRDCILVHEGGSFQIKSGLRAEGNVTFDLRGGEATLALLNLLGTSLGYVDILGRRYRLEAEIPDNVGHTSGYNDQRGSTAGQG